MNQKLRKNIALGLVIIFTGLMTTLDLYHNHSMVFGLSNGNVINKLIIADADQSDAPCPVEQLTYGFSWTCNFILIPEIASQYVSVIKNISFYFNLEQTPRQRGPPLS
ncbi:MAG: hypothetical protein P9L92_14770 [Candidatus Electryonea clarkiae]|nr:hypothetical protein [Candidatus Electryonea clarkiae]MDP8288302.1 hypothetical protein [Candidatus Electryonea clarkiae]